MDQSSTPGTRGVGQAGTGARRSTRSKVCRLTGILHALLTRAPGLPPACHGNGTQEFALPTHSTSVGCRKVRKGLCKGFAGAESVAAKEATNLYLEPHGGIHTGQVCQSARVSTVNLR